MEIHHLCSKRRFLLISEYIGHTHTQNGQDCIAFVFTIFVQCHFTPTFLMADRSGVMVLTCFQDYFTHTTRRLRTSKRERTLQGEKVSKGRGQIHKKDRGSEMKTVERFVRPLPFDCSNLKAPTGFT